MCTINSISANVTIHQCAVPENIHTQPQEPENEVDPAHKRSLVILKGGGIKRQNKNCKTTRKQEQH